MSRREEILCKQVADGGNTSGRVSAKAWSGNLGAVQMNFTDYTNSSHSKNLGTLAAFHSSAHLFALKSNKTIQSHTTLAILQMSYTCFMFVYACLPTAAVICRESGQSVPISSVSF